MGNKRRKYTKDFKKESVESQIRSGKPRINRALQKKRLVPTTKN